eukprot:scaffold8666_cov169-Ochromonas_danica.AAC.1
MEIFDADALRRFFELVLARQRKIDQIRSCMARSSETRCLLLAKPPRAVILLKSAEAGKC